MNGLHIGIPFLNLEDALEAFSNIGARDSDSQNSYHVEALGRSGNRGKACRGISGVACCELWVSDVSGIFTRRLSCTGTFPI